MHFTQLQNKIWRKRVTVFLSNAPTDSFCFSNLRMSFQSASNSRRAIFYDRIAGMITCDLIIIALRVIWERGRSLHRRKYKSARQNLCQFWALNTPKTRQRAYQYDESAIFRLIRQYINEIRYVKSFIRASPPDVGKPHIDDLFL